MAAPTKPATPLKGKAQQILVPDQEEAAPEILANAICDVAKASKKLLNGPLNRRALFLLIQQNCDGKKPTLGQIESVLESAASLGEAFVKDFKQT